MKTTVIKTEKAIYFFTWSEEINYRSKQNLISETILKTLKENEIDFEVKTINEMKGIRNERKHRK